VAPTPDSLAALLGQEVDATQATAVLSVVTSMARAYTRDQGFSDGEPNNDIASVILTCSLRLLAHPRQIAVNETHGPSSAGFSPSWIGWSVAERLTLDRYRVTAL